MYDGKKFEEDFKKSVLNNPKANIDRLFDTMGGYSGIKNICDFIVYRYPCQYYFELKVRAGASLNFKSDISENQWLGLTAKSEYAGVQAGVLIHFRDYDITYFANMRWLNFLQQSGKKSVGMQDCELHGVRLSGDKLRVRWLFNVDDSFLNEINWGRA